MPMLGFLIDRSLPRQHYLYMGLGALFGATALSLLAYSLRRRWIVRLANFITRNEGRPRMTLADLRGELEGGQHHAPATIAPLAAAVFLCYALGVRSEEHTSELQSLMRISYAVFCLKKKKNTSK